MIINNNVQALAGAYAMQQNRAAAPRRTNPVSQASEVVLSQEGKQFNAIFRKIQAKTGGNRAEGAKFKEGQSMNNSMIDDEVRSQKVIELENQVAAGVYNVSNEDIARSLLAMRF